MPQPSISSVHISVPLSNISIAYIQRQTAYVAAQVFPIVPVDKQADKYYKYTKNDWLRDEAQRRAPSTESAGGGFNLTTDSYSCDVWAFHKDVSDQIRSNADAALNMDRDATEFVMQRLLLRRERDFVLNYFGAGIWSYDYAGVAANPGANQFIQWSDYANSDPIGDVKNGRLHIKRTTGFAPNTLTVSEEVFEVLKQHPDILDRYKYTQAGVITADLLAKVFEVDRFIVAGSVYATNVEGAAEAYDFNFGKGALLTYSAPSPGLLLPSAGYIFAWKGLLNNNYGVAISKFRMEHLKSDRIEGEAAFDAKLVASDLGVFWFSAVA